MEIVFWLIVGLVVGGAIGAVATWWISRARGGAVSVMQLKQENDKFRNEVTEHFVETARLINQMTDSYKQVFDHLSSGAEKLVDDKQLAERLPPSTGQEVRLSSFGAASSSQSSAGAPAESRESAARAGNPGSGSGQSANKPKDKQPEKNPAGSGAVNDSGARSAAGPSASAHASAKATSADKSEKSDGQSDRDPLKSPLKRKAEQSRWQSPQEASATPQAKTEGEARSGEKLSGDPDKAKSGSAQSKPSQASE